MYEIFRKEMLMQKIIGIMIDEFYQSMCVSLLTVHLTRGQNNSRNGAIYNSPV